MRSTKRQNWPLTLAMMLVVQVCLANDSGQASASNLLGPGNAGDLDSAASLLDAEERETRDAYEQTLQELRELEERKALQGRLYVRLSKPGFMVLSLGFERFLLRASRLSRLRHSILRDVRHQDELNKRVVALSKQLNEQRKQRGPKSAERLSRLRERTALADAEERALAFERAFASSSEPHTAVYAAAVPFGSAPPEIRTFASMKGRLPFPVAGRTEILLAKRRGGGGPGLELRARPGAVVQAIHPGRVVFSDKYADYGHTIIVDHGGSYFSVSAGVASPTVRIGQEVSAGTKLGVVEGTERGSALYFELRRSGDTENPSEWFGL